MRGITGGLFRFGLMMVVLALKAAPIPSETSKPKAMEAGRFFSQTFGLAELGADPQNWALTQDARGVLYAGNNLGVLEHDGVRWRLIPTRQGTTPRALDSDARGTVYVGGRGEFGKLAPDASGQMRYVSLEEGLAPADRAFSEIWSVRATPEGVYFGARERLFRWNGTQLRAWAPKGAFYSGFRVGDRYLIVDTGQGLLEMKGDTLSLVPGGEAFQAERPRFMVPWEGGSILWGSRTQGLVRFEGGRNHVLPSQANAHLVKQILYAGIRLRDGSFALATIHGGVVLLDAKGQLLRIVNREDGVGDPTVYALHEDRRSGLWLGQSRGITHLEWPARFSVFDSGNGLDGVVVAVHRHRGTLYASTHRGLYRMAEALDPAAPGRRCFVPVAGIQGQCWNLCSVGGRLLAANFDGIFEIQGGQARKVQGDLGHTIALLPCDWVQGGLLVGTANGLYLTAPGRPPEGPLGGLKEVIQTLVAAPDGSVWVGCDAPVVFRVQGTPEGEVRVQRFGAQDGLPSDPWYFTATVRGEPVVFAPSGIFHWNTGSSRFEPDPRTAGLFDREGAPLSRLAEDGEGGLWLGFQRPGNLLRHAGWTPHGTFAWNALPAFGFRGSLIYALHPEGAGVTWFGGVEGLFRFEAASTPAMEVPDEPQVRLAHPGMGAVFTASANPRLPYSEGTLRFEYAMPRGEQAFDLRYQVRLEGQEPGWSPWSSEVYRDYTRLREGSYRFRVRAQAGLGAPIREAILPFRILPPWYRSWWAFAGYGGAGVLLLGFLHRLRVGLLERRNRLLEQRVESATLEVREREARLAEQARELTEANQELRELDAQKNRFLEIVTHDLRNPLHGIAQAAESLQSTTNPELVARTARNIERESLEMGALLHRFLDVASFESGHSNPHVAPVEIRSLLHEALQRHAVASNRKGIALVLEAPEGAWALADPAYVGAVLDNLLSNALKFSPSGTTVHVSVEAERGGLRICVRDQGPGLTQEDRRRLFTRYARLSAQPTGGEGSLGLGLSLTRSMVEALGGRIWAEPDIEVGAVFVVELPSASPPDQSMR